MKKHYVVYHLYLVSFVCLLFISCSSPKVSYNEIKVAAPFPMEPIKECIFPEKDYSIADYGAIEGGKHINTEAISKAIEACNKVGGGRVVIPAGEWLTGPIHFKSNVNLHLEKDAVVRFTDNPEDYLPAVMTSWEGMECYNYSPLVYAFECENIAITGEGMLKPHMDLWKVWFKRPQPHMNALKELYTMASTDVPVEQRQMAQGENHLRPHLIHFNRCKNILLDSFMIRESPFWTIHMYMCDGGIARNLNVKAHGHNSDGIDLEMTRNFLIEDCVFDQGDDGVVIKSGRNHDAWRIGRPTENIVVRNCRVRNAHGLLVVGSEISGGIRNVYMHDCSMDDKVITLFYLKTNHRRGAFIENIYMERVSANRMQRAFAVDTDVLYQWKDLVPTYKDSITAIRNIFMRDVRCHEADGIYEINGDKRLPVKNVNIENLEVDTVRKYTTRAANVEGLNTKNIKWKAFAGKEDK